VVGSVGRIRTEPAAGSAELLVVSREPTPPNADPVLLAMVGGGRQSLIRFVVAFAIVIAGLVGIAVATFPSLDSNAIVVFATTMALLFLIVVITVVRAGSIAGKVRVETHWTELIAVIDSGISTSAAGIATAVGRATLPDGSQVPLRLTKVNVNLVANIAATGRLWIMGPAKVGVKIRIGVPGYPFSGAATLGG
jgi:hypothetical protein